MPNNVKCKIEDENNKITISVNKRCWVCGERFYDKDFNEDKEKPTTHHLIPKRFNPWRNILINVHESCHKRIHENIVEDTIVVKGEKEDE